MGEEWGATSPFPFFCDFKGDVADAVREGRRREYEWAYAKYGDEIPDPLEPSTLQSAMPDWAERDKAAGRKRLALVRELLAIRRREIVPRLPGARFGGAHVADSGLVKAHWRMGSGTTLSLAANLSDHDFAASPAVNGTPIWGRALREGMPAWSVRWHIG